MQDDIFSIDQNCHTLWDVVPKVQALGRSGRRVRHFVEDVDVAFTAMGARAGDSLALSPSKGQLRLARERFHRSGGADWGAAVFYFEFLGRQPVEIRDWEPLTGMKTAALAKHLGCSVDDLYDRFSPSDNWQLIGPSYVTRRDYHRIIGDLSADDAAGFLYEIIDRAEANMLARFPSADCRRRIRDWLTDERLVFDYILAGCSEGRLTDVYRRWLAECTGGEVSLDLTSKLFACGSNPDQTALLEIFTRQYDRAAAIYNRAIEQAGVPLHALRTDDGELPFFASFEHEGHKVRTGVFLREKHLRVGDWDFPLSAGGGIPTAEMSRAGVLTLAGKAMLLVIQARVGSRGRPLALPYRGSPYVPAAHRLAAELAREHLLPEPLHPIVRVRLRFLDRLRTISQPIHLPAYLAAAFGQDEIPASELGDNYADLAAEAAARLESFRTEEGRRQWQRENLPDLVGRIDDLDARRRKLAESAPPPEEIRGLWRQIKPLQIDLLSRTVEQIARDWQVRDLDYWDSRGAILPWSIALGGQRFYDDLIAGAEIYEEAGQ